MKSAPRVIAWVAAAGLLATGAMGCLFAVPRGTTQCQASSDCAHFSPTAVCSSSGICVNSAELGPPGCTLGPLKPGQDFGDLCTTSQYQQFNNCPDGGPCIDPDAGLIPPDPVDAGTPVAVDAGTAPSDAGSAPLPSCIDPSQNRAQAIYITGSSNFPLLLSKVGPLIMTATGYTPVYQVTSSCNGVKSIFSTAPNDHVMADPAPGSKTAAATYVTPTGALVPCSLGAGGVTVDIGESDIFSSSCSGFEGSVSGSASNVGEYPGPIQAMLFVVPSGSSQTVISAEMAREVFGRGGNQGVALPWIDPTLYFVRNANTGTQQMIGRAINVPADQFWGIDRGTAKNLATVLTTVSGPPAERAIGILSSDYYDDAHGNLKELAFQPAGHSAGFWPDSTPNVKDKRSVRDGHYPIWGPLHFFAVTEDGGPKSSAALQFVNTVSVIRPETDLLDAYIDAGLVPSCAMNVQRSSDLGPLSAYVPSIACGCYFETRLNDHIPPAACKTCNTANDCLDPARPACSLGYCEAH